MPRPQSEQLSRRERQIMDVLYRLGRATAAEVRNGLADAPSYSAVRAALRVLGEKDQVQYERESHHYVFWPTVPREVASEKAARRLLNTFFDGSAAKAMAALLECSDSLEAGEIEELRRLVDGARAEGR